MLKIFSNILEKLAKFNIIDNLFDLLKESIDRKNKAEAYKYVHEILNSATTPEEKQEYDKKVREIFNHYLSVSPSEFRKRRPTHVPTHLLSKLEKELKDQNIKEAERTINSILLQVPTKGEFIELLDKISDILPPDLYINKVNKIENPKGLGFLEKREDPAPAEKVKKQKDVTGVWIHVIPGAVMEPIIFDYKNSKTEKEKDKVVAELTRVIISFKNNTREICVSDYKQGNWLRWRKNKLALEFYGTATYAFTHDVWSEVTPAGYRKPSGGGTGAPRCEAFIAPNKCELTNLVTHPASEPFFVELLKRVSENIDTNVTEEDPGVKLEYRFDAYRFSPEHWKILQGLLRAKSIAFESERFIAMLNEKEMEQINRLLDNWGYKELEWHDPFTS